MLNDEFLLNMFQVFINKLLETYGTMFTNNYYLQLTNEFYTYNFLMSLEEVEKIKLIRELISYTSLLENDELKIKIKFLKENSTLNKEYYLCLKLSENDIEIVRSLIK